MTLSFARPRANAIIASSATMDDFFPKSMAFDIGLEQRAYAVCARRAADKTVLDPDVIAIDKSGLLHRFSPPAQPDGPWAVEDFALPELAGATIAHISANEQDPDTGGPRLVVQVAAAHPTAGAIFLTLHRTKDGWTRFTLPPSPFTADHALNVVATGVAGIHGGKMPTFYQCYAPASLAGISFSAYAFNAWGTALLLGTLDNPRGIDHLIAPSLDWSLAICRVENNQVKIFSTKFDPTKAERISRAPVLPVRFDMAHPKVIALPIDCAIKDASAVLPVTDSRGLCHGALITSPQGDLIGCSFLSDMRADQVGVMTGRRTGPQQAVSVAYSFGDGGAIHLFVADRDSQIWYANWTPGAHADQLAWQPTGQAGRNLRAAQRIAGEPRVFVAGTMQAIDQISRAPGGEQWYRSGVSVPSAEPLAVPAIVHAIEISTVTAQSDPVGGEPLEIYADRPCLAEYQGNVVRLSPDRPLRATTGGTGGVRLRLRATGLEAPTLRVRAPELPNLPEALHHPQDGALRKLSGLDPRFRLDGAQLKAAGLVPDTLSGAEADALADAIAAAARQSLRDQAERPEQRHRRSLLRMSAFPERDIRVTFARSPDGAIVAANAPQEPMQAADRAPEAESPAGFWGWLSARWQQIKTFTLEVVTGGLRLIVEAAGRIVEFVTSVGRYIEQGIQAVLAYISKISPDLWEAGRRLAKAIADLLGWDDVLVAKDGVKAFTLAALSDVQVLIGETLRDLISSGLQTAKREAAGLIDRALAMVEGQPVTRQTPQTDARRAAIQRNGATLNIVGAGIPDRPVERSLFELSPETMAKFEGLAAQARAFPENTRLMALLEQVARLFDGKSTIAEGLQILLSTALRTVRELVIFGLDLADALQSAVLEIVANAIGLLRAALVKPITETIGGLGWLDSFYRAISGGAALSLIDLGALVFVTPGVLLTHILTGKNLMDPAKKPRSECRTPLRLAGVLLAGGVQAGTQAGHAEKDWLDFLEKLYVVAASFWVASRSISSYFENMLCYKTVASLPDVLVPPKYEVAFMVCGIIDRMTEFFLFALMLDKLLGDRELDFIRDHLAISVVIGLVMVAILICMAILSIVYMVCVPYALRMYLGGIVEFVFGAMQILFSCIAILFYRPVRPDAQGKNTRFYGHCGVGVWSGAQKMVHLGIPIGGLLQKASLPPIAALGTALVGGHFAGDIVGYLVAGLALTAVYYEN